MKRRWIIAVFLGVFLLGNICGYAKQPNSKTGELILDQTNELNALLTSETKPANNPSSTPIAASAAAAKATPKPDTKAADEPIEKSLKKEPADTQKNPIRISIQINRSESKLVPDAKKQVCFGGIIKIEGAIENEKPNLKLYMGLSSDDKENVQLLDTEFVEKGEGEREFAVRSFSLEPYMKDAELPDSLALFVSDGESMEYVKNLTVEANHYVLLYGLICGACIIAITLCIVMLTRTNRKLQKAKYRLLDMQTRKSQRTMRNEE